MFYNDVGYYLAMGEKMVLQYAERVIADEKAAEQICQDVCMDMMRILAEKGAMPEEEIYKLMRQMAKSKINSYLSKK